MTVEDTKQENVKCSKCGKNKSPDRIVKNRKICKDCCNKKKAETAKKNLKNIDNTENRVCSKCDKEKISHYFYGKVFHVFVLNATIILGERNIIKMKNFAKEQLKIVQNLKRRKKKNEIKSKKKIKRIGR